jgi:hypothetical protein
MSQSTESGDLLVVAVPGALPDGQFVSGVPTDGSPVALPSDLARAYIEAGLVVPVKSAAPAAEVDDKEIE